MVKNSAILLLIFIFVFDCFLWGEIIWGGHPKNESEIYFLNVGQGDSELISLDGNVKVLVDGGPNKNVIYELEKIFQPIDRYIDLVVLTHPQTDHFLGLIDVLKRYGVGAFIFSGRLSDSASFKELEAIINQKKIPILTLAEGDKIKHFKDRIIVIAPNENSLESSEINDTTLVFNLESQGVKALFTGDLGGKVEKSLSEKYGSALESDILKVGHHGSKYSSSLDFLKAVNPKISVIEVGKNSYGHPTPETLSRLANIGSQIFDTLKNGTVKLTLKDGKAYIFTQN